MTIHICTYLCIHVEYAVIFLTVVDFFYDCPMVAPLDYKKSVEGQSARTFSK